MNRADGAEAKDDLSNWIERQYRICAHLMPRAISAVDIVKVRRGFGQTIHPTRGSVLASPELSAYDPDPDYFFHWLRDSALVMDALRELIEDRTLGLDALAYFNDFVEFSLALGRLDGRATLQHADRRAAVAPDYQKFLRPAEELSQLSGDRVLGDARFNADGTLDAIGWSRPQYDGPALRALTAMRFWRQQDLHSHLSLASLRALIETDLDCTIRHWPEPCFDLWEENIRRHYYTRLVQYAALSDGAAWARSVGDAGRAQTCRMAAREIEKQFNSYFDAGAGAYLTPLREEGVRRAYTMRLDIAVILGVIHAHRKEGPQSAANPRMLATLVKLERLFENEYPINHGLGDGYAPAMGRYAGDKYFSGGAYYFSTLGAAQFYYRLANAVATGAQIALTPENRPILAALSNEKTEALGSAALEGRHRARLGQTLIDRGDMFMATVRRYTPESGELSEQFSQIDGAQTSAKNLTWSYAAFITAVSSRSEAIAVLTAR